MKEKKSLFDRQLDFYCYFEDLINFILLMILLITCLFFLLKYFDEEMTEKRNVIEKTKEYEVYDECEYLYESYYCWNEKEVINNE